MTNASSGSLALTLKVAAIMVPRQYTTVSFSFDPPVNGAFPLDMASPIVTGFTFANMLLGLSAGTIIGMAPTLNPSFNATPSKA